jgi:hypothetical protein
MNRYRPALLANPFASKRAIVATWRRKPAGIGRIARAASGARVIGASTSVTAGTPPRRLRAACTARNPRRKWCSVPATAAMPIAVKINRLSTNAASKCTGCVL